MKLPDRTQVLNGFLLASALANFLVACRVTKMNYPTVIHERVVVSNSVEHAESPSILQPSTNSPSSIVSSLFGLSITRDMPTNTPSCVCTTSYQYFTASRRIGAKMFGRYYYEGSPCSYGRISSIFPDRILLADGSWIANSSRFLDGEKIGGNDNDGRAISKSNDGSRLRVR